MNLYYPAFLELSGKNILVVGGGDVALQKIRALLRLGARTIVVAKMPNRAVQALGEGNKVELKTRPFEPQDLDGMDLVFCATDDEMLNRLVSAQCRKRKIWVNVADRPMHCSFIVPAVVRRGDVVFAISTGGASPALAKFLRKKLEKTFGAEVGRLAAQLKKNRGRILALPLAKRRKALARILTDRALAQAKKGKFSWNA